MEKLAEIKEMLKGLSQEEKEELKGILNTADEPSEEAEVKEDSAVEQATEETSEDKGIEQENSDKKAEDIPEEKPEVVKPTETEENSEEVADQAETSEETAEETAEAEESENDETEMPKEEPASEQEDDIPLMQKGVTASEEETVDNGSFTAEPGEQTPVDYKQIIEGQKAKIASLEAEVASLRNKVEGAFGYSAKPSSPAKVNRLYDECEDIHFHK